MTDLVKRLRKCADETWPYAELVSNLKQPETDNTHGRAATAMREAADEIERLREEKEKYKEGFMKYVKAYGEVRKAVIEDMREWIKEWESRPSESVEEFLYQLDAYAKEKGASE